MKADSSMLSSVMINFCRDELRFYLCTSKEIMRGQPAMAKTPIEIYDMLVDTADYILVFSKYTIDAKGNSLKNGPAKRYTIDLYGNPGDVDASQADLDV